MVTINNVNLFKNVNPEIYKKIELQDGGRSGTFTYDSSRKDENDGGVCFNGWVRDLRNNVITPKMFGAKGDYKVNGTDDTAAFEKMITANRQTVPLYTRYGSKYKIEISHGDYGLQYLDLSSYSGWMINGGSKDNTRLIAMDGWTGKLNDNGDKCFILINPFYGDDSSRTANGDVSDYPTSTTSSYWDLSNINIKEETINTDTDSIGVYISRSSQFSISGFSIAGFNKTIEIIHSWVGNFSDGTIREGYSHNLSLGEMGQLNGISFNDVDFTCGRPDHNAVNSNVLFAGVTRVPFFNCYFEGTHTYMGLSNGLNYINLNACNTEYYGKTLVFFNNSGSTLYLNGCIVPSTILGDTATGEYWSIVANGGDLSNSTLKGYLRNANVQGFSGTSVGGKMIIDYDFNQYAQNINIEFYHDLKMIEFNTLKIANKQYHVYSGFDNTHAVNGIHIPKTFQNKQFRIDVLSRPAGQEYEFNNTVEEATFVYKGNEATETSMTKIHEIGSADTELTMTFKEKTTSNFNNFFFWLDDVKDGYVHATMIVRITFIDLDLLS